MRRLSIAFVLVVVLVVAVAAQARRLALSPAAQAYWFRLGHCEEPAGAGVAWTQGGTRFVSGLGIASYNWYSWAPHVGVTHSPPAATPFEQMLVADWGYRNVHAYWGCMATVGYPPS